MSDCCDSKHKNRMMKKQEKKQQLEEEGLKAEKKQKLISMAYTAFFGLVVIAFVYALASFVFTSNPAQTSLPQAANFSSSDPSKLVFSHTNYNLGEVSQAKGNVSTIFKVKNEGKGPLVISSMVTSCMCTSAMLKFKGRESPIFGMHSKIGYWSESIPPGEEAELVVIYDPNVHPDFRGPATRVITLTTNDPINPQAAVRITFNQVN